MTPIDASAILELLVPGSSTSVAEFLSDPGLTLQHLLLTAEVLTIVVATVAERALCPRCGQTSTRVHSRYQRTLADLPCQGRQVRLLLHSRRFFCKTAECPQRIFTERLPRLAATYARTTARLRQTHTTIGFSLGGEAGARLSRRLAMTTSPDTLLRRIKASPQPATSPPRIIGIDDWAWRKGQRYGTILVDLERSRVIDLLPDRDGVTLQSWLKNHPEIEIISRDRSGAYAQAASAAAPQAKQVADRWHLVKNLRETIEHLFERRYGKIEQTLALLQPLITGENKDSAVTPAIVSPVMPQAPTSRSRRQQAQETKRAQRVERYERVRRLHQEGQSDRQIAVTVDLDRETVQRYLRVEQCPDWQPGRARPVPLDSSRAFIDRRLQEGCRNAADLHRELINQGHRISYYAVRRFVRRRLAALGIPRQEDRMKHRPPRPPSARQLAFALIRRPGERSTEEQAQVEAVRQIDEELGGGLRLAEDFAAMMRKTSQETLSTWLHEAEQSGCTELRGFAQGLRQDEEAVTAAFNEPWSNGPVEGHVNRLKAIKRQMYGRAGFDLLRARVVNYA